MALVVDDVLHDGVPLTWSELRQEILGSARTIDLASAPASVRVIARYVLVGRRPGGENVVRELRPLVTAKSTTIEVDHERARDLRA